MKKLHYLPIVILVLLALVVAGCGGEQQTTTGTTGTTGTTQTTTTQTTSGDGGAVSGGTVRVINSSGPAIMGYSLEQGPIDLFILLCAVEKVVEYNENQELVPQLAESFDFDNDNKKINVKIRSGIKFHDGSDCDAEAIVWNYGQQVENKRIGYLDQWGGIEVIDKLNFTISYTGDYNNQLANAWLWSPPMYSMQAFLDAGSGDIEKSKDWARLNVSGTGPFKQAEFKRDVSLRMERFDDYWGGRPYLDAIEYIFIPDPVTASLKMQSGEADMWYSPAMKDQLQLIDAGLVRLEGQPTVWYMAPNLTNPDSKWQNKDLREAVEYALDKEGIATALGFGYYSAAKMIVPEGKMGYDVNWAGRPYNEAKAKELLAKSGYEGASVKLLVLTGAPADTATAVKRFLDDIGLNCEIDIADPGRYYGSLYGTGWDDLILSSFGVMGSPLESFHMNLGDQPLTRMGGWALPSVMMANSQDSRSYSNESGIRLATGRIFMGLSEGAYLIPIYQVNGAHMIQPKFHCTFGQESGFSQYWARYWLEP